MRDLIDIILDSPSFTEKVAAFQTAFRKSLEHTQGSFLDRSTPREQLLGLCDTVRHLLMNRWIATQGQYYQTNTKRLYYLSMEYLLGRLVKNALINLELFEVGREALSGLGLDFDAIAEFEPDPGLGNGGLGRLAACFLDSLSTLSLPVYAYGIRYEFGMFRQVIENQQQKEMPDSWLRYGYPLEIGKNIHAYEIGFGGSSTFHENSAGTLCAEWEPKQKVLAVPHDLPVPGYGTGNVNSLRLWAAEADEEFHFAIFDGGDYVGAVMDKVESEVLSKVLYPNDSNYLGKVLRLKQQYFLVAASLKDIVRRFKSVNASIMDLPEKVVIQLNDTHPTLAVPELMRLLMDEESLDWDSAWQLTQKTIAFTNHTVMPEALECWPLAMFKEILPRHAQIVEEMNRRFLATLRERPIYDQSFIDKVALVSRGSSPDVRMANIAVLTSFSVNGVAALHTELLKEKVFPEFHSLFPKKFHNKTNGISPRRWLLLANPSLSRLVEESIGTKWVTDLEQLRALERFQGDSAFLERLQSIKFSNKERLAAVIKRETRETVDPTSLFDVQVKRIHEYKRQLLKLMECIHHYHFLRDHYDHDVQPRTVIFAGKAAPGYRMAKLLIHLIHELSRVVNTDPMTRGRLKMVFLPNYNVSLAEQIMPAADLNEQISTAGTEASGTGNMKFCLNASLIIGTLDGANIEIREHVGDENMFIFGHKVEELRRIQAEGYHPQQWAASNPGLQLVLESIRRGYYAKYERDHFRPIWESLMVYGDRFFHLADFGSYVEANERAAALFRKPRDWHKAALLNLARIGWFSSDRTVLEYSRDVWHLEPSRLQK